MSKKEELLNSIVDAAKKLIEISDDTFAINDMKKAIRAYESHLSDTKNEPVKEILYAGNRECKTCGHRMMLSEFHGFDECMVCRDKKLGWKDAE